MSTLPFDSPALPRNEGSTGCCRLAIDPLGLCFFLLVLWPIGISAGEFDGARAFQYLEKQCSFGPRNPGSPGHSACRQFLVKELQKFAAEVEEQPFLYYDALRKQTLNMTNILARFNPTAEKHGRASLLLCAHWDTRPTADEDRHKENRNQPILGANDGASGVAVLLEIARQLSQVSPTVGIDIVLFDGEDYGREGHLEEYFLGSRHFVEANTSFYPRYAVLLDMVGDAQLRLPIERFSRENAPAVVDKIWNLAASMARDEFVYEDGLYVQDDHVILNEAGIPAVDIIDFSYPEEGRNYWHTTEDTPDKCSPQSLAAVGSVLLKLIYDER